MVQNGSTLTKKVQYTIQGLDAVSLKRSTLLYTFVCIEVHVLYVSAVHMYMYFCVF